VTALRRTGLAALLLAFAHVVFGAIVRISGSGMGCIDRWPRCADPRTGQEYWFPPLDYPILVIEWTHRLVAGVLILAIVAVVAAAWRRRTRPGVAGPGGPLRAAALSLAIVLSAAVLGAVTVRTWNTPVATVAHKLIAAALLAALAATVVRAGGLGAQAPGAVTPRASRGALAAAGLALAVVAMGGFTAKIPDAAVACAGFPLCGDGSLGGGPQHVQLTHRVLAYALVLHLVGLPLAFRRRGEPAALRRLAGAGALLGVLQVAWAAWMVLGGFPGVVRSLHQATGVAIWVVAFTMAYVARLGVSRVASRVPGAREARDASREPLPGFAR
jgi:heme A synthase